MPDYEGRPAAGASPGEVALWIPRVLFAPLYFTSEYVIRRPLGALITAAERSNLPQFLYDFFAFGPDHQAGIAPIAFFDFGFNPSVGAYAFWNNAFFKGDDLRLHASFWSEDWLAGSFVQRMRFAPDDSVQLRFLGVRRPDYVFYGIGPNSRDAARSRYGEDKFEVAAQLSQELWRASKVEAGVSVRSASFYDGRFGGDAGILESVRAASFPLPVGFAQGYTAVVSDLLLALDSRRPFPSSGSGVRVEALGEEGSDFRRVPGPSWLRYAASAAGFLDIDGHRRIVSLTATALFSDPLGSRSVPFTELVTLGGDNPGAGSFPTAMQGFFVGRLVDRSAALVTLRYKWPIGPWVSGSMQAAVGNVFGEHLDGLDARLGRFSGALGLESDRSPDSNFDAIVGIGTDTFERGARIESIRVALGVSRF